MTSEGMRRRVSSTSDGIGLSLTFFNEMVIEQAHSDEALQNGGVGEPDAGIDSDNVRTAAIGSDCEIADVPCDLGATSREWIRTLALADQEVIGEAAGVRLDRAWRQPEVGLDLQPVNRLLTRRQNGPTQPR